CFQGCLDGGQVATGTTAEQVTCGGAQIGTVKIQPEAVPQVSYRVFSQTSIRTRSARLGAFETRCNAVGQLLHVPVGCDIRMCFDHGCYMTHEYPPSIQIHDAQHGARAKSHTTDPVSR